MRNSSSVLVVVVVIIVVVVSFYLSVCLPVRLVIDLSWFRRCTIMGIDLIIGIASPLTVLSRFGQRWQHCIRSGPASSCLCPRNWWWIRHDTDFLNLCQPFITYPLPCPSSRLPLTRMSRSNQHKTIKGVLYNKRSGNTYHPVLIINGQRYIP